MRVNEIFKSCQGEGPGARLPTIFVRLAGCNLALAGTPCVWCDTKYAQPFLGKGMTVGQIVEDVERLSRGCMRVCITGGEPLYQITELRDLVDTLVSREYFVEVFTNGTLFPPLSFLHLVDSWTVDIKCPSSQVSHKCRTAPWIGALRAQDAIKFVVESELDLTYVSMSLGAYSTRAQVFVSPCITSDVLQEDSRAWLQTVWEFCVEHNYCYGLQIHKVVFGNKRGV